MEQPEHLDEALEETFPASDPVSVDNAAVLHDNEDQQRFELALKDGGLAFVCYRRGDRVMELTHTEVPKDSREHGIGTKLVLMVLDRARAEDREVVATCPFVEHVAKEHGEYGGLVKAKSG